MGRTGRIIWSCVGILVMGAMLVGAVVWGYLSKPAEAECRGITYIFEDRAERMYLSENELTAMLQAENIYPVGKNVNQVSLHRIERTVGRHPMIRTAECYMTARHEVRVRLTQRIPVLRVQTAIESFLIDSDRKVMQARSSVRDELLIARGAVGVQLASGKLADFALWIAENEYWQDRIDYIYVQSVQMIYLYLKQRDERIVMGNLKDFEKKMNKLRLFLLNSGEATKDKHYQELDLRYKGQVIGRY
ncbi:MAG: hypothetical protein J6T71_01645 [Paludibacteraceae bacterium]|nr:hypothetical protein [Paludibacteraceae bacterium]